ncbi:MAG: hypothetical protein ONB44_12355 [candidate division KSB1 bacterium]|nr:hypothetical protein [candidate division KSB1 bacterium]MDZ7302913.1 hypothetical protein [candidate division KSB1 bacterium]MDZ7310488.1 hypothetical protein [candidate division KSB1 bacterium]
MPGCARRDQSPASYDNRNTAGKTNLRFDFVEVWRSTRYAISLRLLSIQHVAFVPGYAIYVFLTYASLLLTGCPLAATWRQWGLFPCLFASGRSHPLAAWIFCPALASPDWRQRFYWQTPQAVDSCG